MKKLIEKYKNFREEETNIHWDFMKSRYEKDNKIFCCAAIALSFYSLLFSFLYATLWDEHDYAGLYGILFTISLLAILLSRTVKYVSNSVKYHAYVVFIIGILLIVWSLVSTRMSVLKDAYPNFLSMYILPLFVSQLFYVAIPQAVVLAIIGITGGIIVVQNSSITPYTKYTGILLAIALEVFYIVKYRSRLKLFIQNKELDERSKKQKMFTASLNHEMRSPLNGIIGGIQMLSESSLSEKDMDIVSSIANSSKALLSIVNDILDFNKLEAGEFKITKEPFNPEILATTTKDIFNSVSKAKGLELIIETHNLHPIIGDEIRLQQIINNLVSNGIKYTKEGFVKLCLETDSENLFIEIQDSGEGMSEETIKDLFTPYKRINEGQHKNIQGTGLGMSVVDGLVKQMDGKHIVTSKLGEGTSIRIIIPTEEAPYTKEEDVDISSITVLYVDDSKVNLKVFESLLKNEVKSVKIINSPIEAIEECSNTKYDIIITDHLMPEMDGTELYVKIRQSEVNRDTPICICTADNSEELKEMFFNLGFCDYLFKPFDIKQIKKAIGKNTCKTDSKTDVLT